MPGGCRAANPGGGPGGGGSMPGAGGGPGGGGNTGKLLLPGAGAGGGPAGGGRMGKPACTTNNPNKPSSVSSTRAVWAAAIAVRQDASGRMQEACRWVWQLTSLH